MSPKAFQKKNGDRSERWVESLLGLARSRGDAEAVAQRAVTLSRQLNLSPWIALGIAERLITMAQARELDRVGRCKELQPAILDKRRSVEELKFLMPYAAHFLAVELLESREKDGWNDRVVIRILEAILGAEKKTGEEGISFRVRIRPLDEYSAMVERVLAIMKRTRCEVGMALDVDAGRMAEPFASDYMRQKRALELEERRMKESARQEAPRRFPPRRQEGEGAARRPVFQHTGQPHLPLAAPRDHWPKA